MPKGARKARRTWLPSKKMGGPLTRATRLQSSSSRVSWEGLEGEDRPEFRAPVGRIAGWQSGNLGGANTFGIGKSLAMVVAFFKAELDPGIHLVEHGRSPDRALDGAA